MLVLSIERPSYANDPQTPPLLYGISSTHQLLYTSSYLINHTSINRKMQKLQQHPYQTPPYIFYNKQSILSEPPNTSFQPLWHPLWSPLNSNIMPPLSAYPATKCKLNSPGQPCPVKKKKKKSSPKPTRTTYHMPNISKISRKSLISSPLLSAPSFLPSFLS